MVGSQGSIGSFPKLVALITGDSLLVSLSVSYRAHFKILTSERQLWHVFALSPEIAKSCGEIARKDAELFRDLAAINARVSMQRNVVKH